jgi:NAD(P)-dependent dehydrogenase (short-subunit alcohol dehydrogenase family)
MAISADVTRDADLETAVRMIIERLGRITILVNNAGFAPPRASVLKTALTDWDRTLATCLRAPMVLTRLVLPDMLAHGHGAIINIASLAGKKGRAGEAAYAAAKFGLLGFTQSLFAEVRDHGIKVVAVCPGLVDTDLIPPNRRVDRSKFLQPSDIATAVCDVLASPLHACPDRDRVEPQRDPEAQAERSCICAAPRRSSPAARTASGATSRSASPTPVPTSRSPISPHTPPRSTRERAIEQRGVRALARSERTPRRRTDGARPG